MTAGGGDAAQLRRDLAASEEREHDLCEQLRFAEDTTATLRRKLADADDELETVSLQLRELTSKRAAGPTQREVGLQLRVDLAEQETGVLRRQLDTVGADNDNLLTAVKYLRAKLEPGASRDDEAAAVTRLLTGVEESRTAGDALERCRDELGRLRRRVAQVEADAGRAAPAPSVDDDGGPSETAKSTGGDVEEMSTSTADLEAECARLRRLVSDLLQRQDASSTDGGAAPATDTG